MAPGPETEVETLERLRHDEVALDRALVEARREAEALTEEAHAEAARLAAEAREGLEREIADLRAAAEQEMAAQEARSREETGRRIVELRRLAGENRGSAAARLVAVVLGEEP